MNLSFEKLLFFGVLLGLCFSCTPLEEDGTLDELIIFPDLKTDKYSHRDFFSHNIGFISSNEEYICLPDRDLGTFFILDLDLNPVDKIGSKGKGPTDFLGAQISFFLDNELLLFDFYLIKVLPVKLQDFAVGEPFLMKIKPEDEQAIRRTRFSMDEEMNILLSGFEGDFPHRKYSKNGHTLLEFGTFFEYDDPKHKLALNYSHIVENSQKDIFIVSFDKPIIKKFDSEGKKIYECTFENLFKYHVDDINNKLAENPDYKYITWSLFRDVAISSNRLFLLYWSNEEFKEYDPYIRQTSFQVLELRDEGDTLIPIKIYNLSLPKDQEDDFRIFSRITVQGKALYAFDKRSQALYRYMLE